MNVSIATTVFEFRLVTDNGQIKVDIRPNKVIRECRETGIVQIQQLPWFVPRLDRVRSQMTAAGKGYAL